MIWMLSYEHGECVKLFSSKEFAMQWVREQMPFLLNDAGKLGPWAWLDEVTLDPDLEEGAVVVSLESYRTRSELLRNYGQERMAWQRLTGLKDPIYEPTT